METGATQFQNMYLLGRLHLSIMARILGWFWSLLFLSSVSAAGPLQNGASTQSIDLQIIGGLANVNQYTRHEEPFWTSQVTEKTKGQVRASIKPFDKSGVMGNEVLKLVRTGVISYGTILAGVSAGVRPLWSAADLPGMNRDIATLRQSLNAIRPDLERTILNQDGIVVLAMYAYPAQVIFCRDPIEKLSDLSGLKVRVSTVTQSEFLTALGAKPISVPFAEIPLSLKRRVVDCVVTGSMSGYTLGLHELTTHILALPINWGLSIFGANKDSWAALPKGTRDLLRNDLLPKLEQDIWDEANRETDEGLSCLSGNGRCFNGPSGNMTVIRPSVADFALAHRVFTVNVLPSWLRRCDHECEDLWNKKLKSIAGH